MYKQQIDRWSRRQLLRVAAIVCSGAAELELKT